MPKFDIFSGAFVITFFKRRVSEGVNEGVSEGVSEGVKTLYKYIESNPGKRTTEMSLALNIPQKTIERWMSLLRKVFFVITIRQLAEKQSQHIDLQSYRLLRSSQ